MRVFSRLSPTPCPPHLSCAPRVGYIFCHSGITWEELSFSAVSVKLSLHASLARIELTMKNIGTLTSTAELPVVRESTVTLCY